PGVRGAVVNLATERATVELAGDGPSLADLRQAVDAAGYTVPVEIAATPESEDREQARRRSENRLLQWKFLVGAALSVLVLVGSMPEGVPWAPRWLRDPWLLRARTTPVRAWRGWQSHRRLS